MATCSQLDKTLTELAGRLGSDGLEVELRQYRLDMISHRDEVDGESRRHRYDQKISLPKFVQVGRVTTFDLKGNQVHSSDDGVLPILCNFINVAEDDVDNILYIICSTHFIHWVRALKKVLSLRTTHL